MKMRSPMHDLPEEYAAIARLLEVGTRQNKLTSKTEAIMQ